MEQMTKILLEDQQKTLPTFEEPRRVDVDAMELHELVANEKGSTSPEMEEKRKEFKTTPSMIIGGKVHGKLENQKMTPISKLDEIIFELNENLKAASQSKESS